MTRGRVERQIDDALLAVAMSAGFLYVRRRIRRAARTLGRAGMVLAAGAAAVAVLGVAGGAAARRRRSS